MTSPLKVYREDKKRRVKAIIPVFIIFAIVDKNIEDLKPNSFCPFFDFNMDIIVYCFLASVNHLKR
jgi:hypothetical protein